MQIHFASQTHTVNVIVAAAARQERERETLYSTEHHCFPCVFLVLFLFSSASAHPLPFWCHVNLGIWFGSFRCVVFFLLFVDTKITACVLPQFCFVILFCRLMKISISDNLLWQPRYGLVLFAVNRSTIELNRILSWNLHPFCMQGSAFITMFLWTSSTFQFQANN